MTKRDLSDPPAASEDDVQPASETDEEYRVLARKYRPERFSELIGQEAMVRTLINAISSKRLAHAFILTGVRGVGKTTTARIIARILNCIGPDGQGDMTVDPCGVCEHCRSISETRHVDVLEMDAASRTGVGDIRELIDGVRYRPVSARYKVYIIDEVHMLSRAAFNALLKTLEEPPEHVKFVFATTETRKIPVTVLSRCQRFDLRRVDGEVLAAHFAAISEKEGVRITPPALHLIARAADGSVRDGLSLLDQAIASGSDEVNEEHVRDMLALADRMLTFDLFEAVMSGNIVEALDVLTAQYAAGADPSVVLEDLLDLVHWITRAKLVPKAIEGIGVPEAEKVRGGAMAEGLSMGSLSRAWQMLLKGIGELRVAPSPVQAAEMVLIRMAYTADLPTPEEAIKSIDQTTPAAQPSAQSSAPQSSAPQSSKPQSSASQGMEPQGTEPAPVPSSSNSNSFQGHAAPRADGAAKAIAVAQVQDAEPVFIEPASFEDVVALAAEKSAMILHANLIGDFHLVHFEPGRIEFHPGDHAPSDLANRLSRFLNENTSKRWLVTVSQKAGENTLHQKKEAKIAEEKVQAAKTELVKSVLEAFPGTIIETVRPVSFETKPGDEKE
jgi:DNA polymerase III subunit gamma/tau